MINEPWQIQYIEMMGDPMESYTQEQFCQSAGVSRSTLYRWKRDNQAEIDRLINIQLDKNIKALRPIAFKSLASKLKDAAMLKLFFQISGDLVERSEVTQHLSVEQKRAMAQDLMNKLSAQLPVDKKVQENPQ